MFSFLVKSESKHTYIMCISLTFSYNVMGPNDFASNIKEDE